MHNQINFNLLTDSAKWSEYKYASLRGNRFKERFDSVVDVAHQVLDIFQVHEVGCNSRSAMASLVRCNCALSPLAYAVGWNEGHEDDG